MYFVNRMAVVLKPTQVFLDWLNQDDEITLTLAQLRSNCSVYLLPEFDTPEQAVGYVNEHYKNIFVAELSSWTLDNHQFPTDLSLENFWRFFELDVHDTVLDLHDGIIENENVIDTDV